MNHLKCIIGDASLKGFTTTLQQVRLRNGLASKTLSTLYWYIIGYSTKTCLSKVELLEN